MNLVRMPLALLLLSLFAIGATSCGGKKESEETKSTFGALKEYAEKVEELSQKEPVEPVAFQELKELLPEKLVGLPRTASEGQGSGNLGFQVTMAKGTYSDDEKSLDLDIMDLGGIGGAATAGLAAWTLAETERETEDGYERTIRLDGHKGFERYNSTYKDAELKIFYNDRFLISLEGNNLSMDELKSAFRQINLSSLPKN